MNYSRRRHIVDAIARVIDPQPFKRDDRRRHRDDEFDPMRRNDERRMRSAARRANDILKFLDVAGIDLVERR